jgi:hypothetical protein
MKHNTKRDKINAARIQRAVTGLQIPMLQMPALYRHMEQALAMGADEQDLRLCAVTFLNPCETEE